jgi:hypothetical protein
MPRVRLEVSVVHRSLSLHRALFMIALTGLGLSCSFESGRERPEARVFMAAFLEGETRFCVEDGDCRTELCTWGSCAGILSGDRGWMSERIVEALKVALEEAGLETTDAVAVLRGELAKAGRHVPIQRARILRAWRHLDLNSAGVAAAAILRESAEDADSTGESRLLRFEAARVRLSLGDREAAEILIDWLTNGDIELCWFLLPEWRFFAETERAAIIDLVEKKGPPELRARLTTLQR